MEISCTCSVWYLLVNWICAAVGISSLDLKPHPGQRSRLWQTADHTGCSYHFSRLLSSPIHTFPLLSSFVRKRGVGGGGGGGWTQIRLLPQKLPITAWQCVQHCRLRNADFVSPVQLKGILYVSSILAVVLNESSSVVWITGCILHG